MWKIDFSPYGVTRQSLSERRASDLWYHALAVPPARLLGTATAIR
ncbi:hypothetical protein [Rubripirellula lacrimiformis]|nr:hypothetical protein [Rubripirellula lacrimiformis]